MKLSNLTFRGKRIYYGWIMVAGLAAEGMVSTALLGINFGLFINPISKELGIKQSFFGWAQTARLAGTAASSFPIGRLLDRHGARWPMMVAGILVGAAVMTMSRISVGWQMLALFALMGLNGLQGVAGNLYAMVPLSHWFRRNRGKAMSMVVLGTPIGIFIAAPLTQFLISSQGWRSTLVMLGLTGGIVIALLALLIRRAPEEMGLLPDGDSPDQQADAQSENKEKQPGKGVNIAEYSWTREEAVRSFTFWKLSVAFGLSMFAASTLGLFRIPFFVSRGIAPQIVAYSLSFEALVNFIMTFPISYAIPRIQPRYLLVLSSLSTIGSFLTAMATTQVWHAFLATSFFGMGAVSRAILQNTLWPDYFGPRNVGSIRGLSMPLTMAFSFGGAPIAGMVKDATGSYDAAWWVAIALLVLSAALFLMTPKVAAPKKTGTVTAQP